MKNFFASGSCLFLAFLCHGQDSPGGGKTKPSLTIVFVCEHGAARSTIAAAYFNKLASEQGLNYRAVFRGTNADSVLIPAAQQGLLKDGFAAQAWKPAALGADDLHNAHRVVTVDCPLPGNEKLAKPPIEWTGIPAVSAGYDAARDSIVKKVQALLAELSRDNR